MKKTSFRFQFLALASFAFVTALPVSQAHLKIGTYEGTSPSGETCAVEIQEVRFEGNVHHPINERVQVRHQGKTWTLHHPALIQAEEGTVRPSSDTLESAVGSAGVADAFQLVMSHAPGKDGPIAFHSIHDDYKDASKSSVTTCRELAFKVIE